MNYHVVDGDPVTELAIEATSEALEPMDWLGGGLRDFANEPLRLEVRAPRGLPDLDTHLLPIASSRLRTLLDAERIDNLQYRPARIANRERRIVVDQWAFNVLGLVEAVDRTSSEAEPYLGGPGLVLGRFALDPSRVDGARLFRLAEAPHLLIADDDLAARLRDAALVGVRVRPTEAYDGH
jgi:hypothetical protein